MATNQFERFELTTAPLGEGTVLLEASAGTGKTYTLTGIVVRMVLEDVVEHIEQALIVTFTVAAADELKNRLRAALQTAHAVCLGKPSDDLFFAGLARFGKPGATKLRRALNEFDQASVMTIHGFCKRVLDESAFESNQPFDLDFAVDEAPLWHAAAADALRLIRRQDSLMLGVALHESKIDPDALVALYRNWQRYPDVELRPSEPQLAVHLANLRAAMHQAAAKWDQDLIVEVADLPWLANKCPFPNDVGNYLQRASERMRQHAELALPLFVNLARQNLRSRLFKSGQARADQPFFAGCDEVANGWLLVQDHLRSELLQLMRQRLARHKRERALLTFDDLLERTQAAVCDPARRDDLLRVLQQRYAVALIDEFQDTDARQYAILSRCFANRPLFLVGDPKQSIYGFRGADLRTYLAAGEHAVLKNTLTVNFRSSPQLVEAVNHLFARDGAFVEAGIQMRQVRANASAEQLQITGDDGPALRFRLLPITTTDKGTVKLIAPEEARQRIAADVTSEIGRLLDGDACIDGRPILPRHIAVLTRRNIEAVLVQELLRSNGIVSVIGKAGDVFETDELVELERLLLAIQRPNDLMRARAALTTRLWGYDALQLAALEHDDEVLERELNRLDRWRQLWIRRGFVVMKEQLLSDLDVDARMLRRNDGERRLTNLQQLCEMLHQAEHEHRLSPEGLLHWLRRERAHKDEIDYQRRELRLESDDDAVQILTMHGSKGLQYEIVFCPFLWDGRAAPTKNTAIDAPDHPGTRTFAFEIEDTDAGWLSAERDRLAEDMRLAYVALTRAKRRCYVHWGTLGWGRTGFWHSALGWLLHPDGVDQLKPDWQRTWSKACRDRGPHLATDLQRVVDQANGTIGIEPVTAVEANASPSPTAAGRRDAEPALERRSRRMPTRYPLVVHSFSSLVAGSEPGSDAYEVRDPASEDAVPGSGIFGFARGAKAGLCLHTILEHVDLAAVDSRATAERIEQTLTLHGLLDPTAHPGDLDPSAAVRQNLHDLAAARTRVDGPTIAEVCGGQHIAEWQFTIPVAAPNLEALATCFKEHGDEFARGYAARLRGLLPRYLAGFLTGFLDLVAEHDGGYWLLDWKSNHLGNDVADYGPDALLKVMLGHDYVLQYHLYVLALHRHLRARLPNYDYEHHLAGVCYPFLRGAVADTNQGMFYARPPRALVEAMDAWAAGQPVSGATR